MHAPSRMRHILPVLSSELVNKEAPSRETTADETKLLCRKVCMQAPVAVLQSLAGKSNPYVNTHRGIGMHTTAINDPSSTPDSAKLDVGLRIWPANVNLMYWGLGINSCTFRCNSCTRVVGSTSCSTASPDKGVMETLIITTAVATKVRAAYWGLQTCDAI